MGNVLRGRGRDGEQEVNKSQPGGAASNCVCVYGGAVWEMVSFPRHLPARGARPDIEARRRF